MSPWIRKYLFEVAALAALTAVMASCVSTYRALEDLPGIQRTIVSLEERLERLSGLRSVLGLANWHLRVGGLADGDVLNRQLTAKVSRGQQFIDELQNQGLPDSTRSVVNECHELLAQLDEFAADSESWSADRRNDLRKREESARSRIAEHVAEGRIELQSLRRAATTGRREAVHRLLGGHGLMLAVVGLLYAARRAERRRRELADLKLLEADERFALIVRGSADGIILTDASGRIQVTNPALEQMFATTADDLEGALVSSRFETIVIDEWIANRLHEDGEAVLSRTVIARKSDGECFNAELTITPRMIRDQEFLAISVRDVSEREVSRLRLKQHEALLREIPEPLHILDAVGRVVYWNVGAQRLYGYTGLEALGKTANDLLKIVPPEGDSENVHARQYADADRWTGQLQAVTKDGRSLLIERRRTRISEGDATIGEVIFDLDLGERSRLQKVERRRQRLEALGTLASGIAHDLNNLLTPILMSSRMLQRGGEHLDREALLDTIVSGASRGAELISQLLTFARGGEGPHGPVPVRDVLAEVSGILKHTLNKRISLKVNVEPEVSEIFGDATEISQVIMNLAINARDAMPEGGTLGICAKSLTLEAERTYSLVTLQPGSYCAISVSDTGVGIPQSIRDRIFDPFFSTKERGQGTGLGLSTSLGIIRSHDGAIDIESSVGEGTTVTVILPTIDRIESDTSTS